MNFEPLQDFAILKEQHLEIKKLFKDGAFPIKDPYFYKFGNLLKWKRPGEIVKKPLFFSNGAQRFDVVQGGLGDCWLLAGKS